VTAFEDLDRGDIVWASDPLSEKGRPMLVLGTPQLPNHGPQLNYSLDLNEDLPRAVDHQIKRGRVPRPDGRLPPLRLISINQQTTLFIPHVG